MTVFFLAFQIKLGKMQKQTTKMIHTREKETQDLNLAINSFKVYLPVHIDIKCCYEVLIFLVTYECIQLFYFIFFICKGISSAGFGGE